MCQKKDSSFLMVLSVKVMNIISISSYSYQSLCSESSVLFLNYEVSKRLLMSDSE